MICTGHTYPINPGAPEEGRDIHHDRPCPAHPDAERAAVAVCPLCVSDDHDQHDPAAPDPTGAALAAPATAWALEELRRRSRMPGGYGALASVTGRAVLLALAACSDEALNSPHGYDGIPAAHLARLVGLAPATVVRWLRSLEALNLATNQRGRLWRVPEEAFNR